MSNAKIIGVASHRELGVGMIELMIAMVLGLVLMTGVVEFFTTNKKTYRTQAALASVEENGRFAVDIITRDLRNAGFFGCSGNTAAFINTLSTSTSIADSYNAPLSGYEATASNVWTPALDPFIETPLSGTDILVTHHPNPSTRTYVLSHSANNIKLSDQVAISANDVVLLADCSSSAIFKVASVTQDSDNLPIITYDSTTNLGRQYAHTAEVQQISSTAYFVRQTGTTSGRPGLWRRDSSGTSQELVEGVEALQIRYGFDSNNDKVPDQYYAANNIPDLDSDGVPDWGNVVTVRMDLLLSTVDDNVVDQAQAYTFNGTKYDGVVATGHGALPTDHRYRQSYTATVAIRNTEL